MTADLLRQAARRLREVAGAARGGKWSTNPGTSGWTCLRAVGPDHSTFIAQMESLPDARYIAAMSPPVALALADLLANEANAMDGNEYEALGMTKPPYNEARARLLGDVARAFLGEPS